MKPTGKKTIILACGATVALALTLCVFAFLYVSGKRAGQGSEAASPGEMLDAGGMAFHAVRMGEGAPLVVLESGLCASSLEWLPVQRDIARFAPVMAYDRAGYGASPKAEGPRTADAAVDGLRALLDSVGAKRPVVIVGHDAGALYALRFAARHPSMVRGLVLVDPFPDDTPKYKSELEAAVYRNFIDRAWLYKAGRAAAGAGIVRALKITPYLRAPAEIRPFMVDFFSDPATYDTALAEYRALSAPSARPGFAPARVPVTIIRPSREKYLDHMLFFGVPVVEARKIEVLRDAQDGRLLSRSIAPLWVESNQATSTVHLEDPAVIVDAVRKIIGK
ncbi:MAG TPA: alpha/beta hydrolase [Spirochaetota bacterium]|nr:alpha/beta hydrolase [Spirochaetota bacterium]